MGCVIFRSLVLIVMEVCEILAFAKPTNNSQSNFLYVNGYAVACYCVKPFLFKFHNTRLFLVPSLATEHDQYFKECQLTVENFVPMSHQCLGTIMLMTYIA